jgi:hypothetical protein
MPLSWPPDKEESTHAQGAPVLWRVSVVRLGAGHRRCGNVAWASWLGDVSPQVSAPFTDRARSALKREHHRFE